MGRKQRNRTKKIRRLRPRLPYTQTDDMVSYDAATGTDRFDDVFRVYRPGRVTGFERENAQTYTFQSEGHIVLRVQTLTPEIIRVRYGTDNTFDEDFSYAIDEKFTGDEMADYHFLEHDDFYEIGSARVVCRIQKADGRVEFSDADRYILMEEAEPFRAGNTILKGLTDLNLILNHRPGTHYFGLGDKAGSLDLLGSQYSNWCEDSFGFGAQSDHLYRAIPFHYGLTPEGIAYGIFIDNSYRSTYDFANLNADEVQILLEGGEMNYYFIYGPGLDEVTSRYMQLTGTPDLVPMWALGYHQSRWSYYPEQEVYELAERFRRNEMPCDAIYLDIDYMDDYRCFTWNRQYFPDPARMTAKLREQGFHVVTMIDPGLKVDDNYWVYQEGLKHDAFCKRSNGELMIGPVWPSDCVWPDYTDPKVRDWWGGLYRELYAVQGISGFWNDMNEPAVFRVKHMTFPDNVLHHYDGHPTDHRKAHNIYGMQMTRASLEGLKKIKPDKRPFLLGRASFSGGQRYAALWTGDNVASWEHLQIANRQCQRLSISGFSLVGTDVGGFAQEPDGELYLRWMQLAVFHPVYRSHTMGNNDSGDSAVDKEARAELEELDRRDQEPWTYGEPYTTFIREALELRYRLLGYLYTALCRHSRTGTPVIRSLIFADQTNPDLIERENEFLFGRHLIAAPVTLRAAITSKVYLPGGEWYNFHTGISATGGEEFEELVNNSSIPLYARAGSVIPLYNVRQHTSEPVTKLTLRIFRGTEATASELYEDAGEGYGYRNRDFLNRLFTTQGRPGSFSIRQQRDGDFHVKYTSINVEVAGFANPRSVVRLGEETIDSSFGDGFIRFEVPVDFKSIEILG